MYICNYCKKEFIPKYKENKFCSKSCSAKASNPKRRKRFCKNCGDYCKKGGRYFCSKKCMYEFKRKKMIQDWLDEKWDGLTPNKKYLSNIVRDYLIEKSNFSCEACGWNKINLETNICPLCIHHIDGNYKNNRKSNLQVLCPNCHSLTRNFGGRNKGNGREWRYKD